MLFYRSILLPMNNIPEIVETEDGSHTLRLQDSEITFHSVKGAIKESMHVFIESGFVYFLQNDPGKKPVSVFEVGFGTGLNALLTATSAAKNGRNVIYHSIEKQPLPIEIYSKLNYPDILNERDLYKTIMQTGWNQELFINSFFKLQKISGDLETYRFNKQFDVIYFDAFAPNDQEEMWTENNFKKMFEALNKGGVLVTYCSKGNVRRAMAGAGFVVEKIPGPPGKREIVRASKPGK